jgi:hypothetical protein
LTDAFVAGDAQATTKLNRLASQERAAFSGNSAVNPASLSSGTPGQY